MSFMYKDTDSFIPMDMTEYRKYIAKLCLNAMYGTAVTEYEKENKDMNKNYIVVHDTISGLGIVFKDKIGGIFKDSEDGTAKLLVVDGYMLITTDKYEDIIKQIV